MRYLFALLFVVLSTSIALAAEPSTVKQPSDTKERTLLALPVMLYSSDTGLGLGAAGIKSYRTGADRSSTIQAIGIYTTKRQINVGVKVDHYFATGRRHLNGEVSYQKIPTLFFGLGNETDNDNPENYTPEYAELELYYEFPVIGQLNLRTIGSIQNFSLLKCEKGGLFDSGVIPWAEGRIDASAGLGLVLDTRDNTMAPRQGLFARAEYIGMVYQNEGGAGNIVRLEARGYRQVRHDWVLAGMVRVDGAAGSLPYYMLPFVGGDERLRGFESSRFRDRIGLVVQQDMRFPVWGPVGAAVFWAVGRVGHEIGDFDSGRYHAAGGAGLRYYINRKDNLLVRCDYARGSDSDGVYISFGEAY